jgi:hypothetical protein
MSKDAGRVVGRFRDVDDAGTPGPPVKVHVPHRQGPFLPLFAVTPVHHDSRPRVARILGVNLRGSFQLDEPAAIGRIDRLTP